MRVESMDRTNRVEDGDSWFLSNQYCSDAERGELSWLGSVVTVCVRDVRGEFSVCGTTSAINT